MTVTMFLGAGASSFAGMPTTKDLIPKISQKIGRGTMRIEGPKTHLARNVVNEHDTKDVEILYKAIDDMIEAEHQHKKIAVYKTTTTNGARPRRIETLQSSLKRQRYVDKTTYGESIHFYDNTIREETDVEETINTLESLKLVIRDTLLGEYSVKSEQRGGIMDVYGKLFDLIDVGDVFTTNYDNVLETYCELKGLILVNGFKKSYHGDMRKWDGEQWQKGKDMFRLTKLHGSVTWQKDDDGTILEIGKPGIRNKDRDVMIYPSLGEKDYSDDVFPTLMKRFETILNNTKVLIVIGCSFRDTKINEVIINRLKPTKKNPNPMKLLYVDRAPDGLKELLGDDVSSSEVTVQGNIKLLNYSYNEISGVYAFCCPNFGQDSIPSINLAFESVK